MTLKIEVSGELEEALKAHAREQGITIERLVHGVLSNALTPGSDQTGTTGEEKARAFVRWAKAHRDTPPLSHEAYQPGCSETRPLVNADSDRDDSVTSAVQPADLVHATAVRGLRVFM